MAGPGNQDDSRDADGLTPRQRLFALEYLKNPNATQAAVAAGYSEKTARVQGPRLLQNVAVGAFLAKKATRIAEKLELDATYVLQSLKNVAERCQQAVPVMVYDREAKEHVQAKDEKTGEGLWEFDSSGANKALELLGKHLALFTEKLEASGPGGGPLEIVITDLSKEDASCP